MLVVDKPAGKTSFDVVRQVRRLARGRRAGHTGTLDPMATGVLPVCVGEATKIAGMLTAGDKEYLGVGLLGVETDTLDTTGVVTGRRDPGRVERQTLEQTLSGFLGPQMQTPPAHSAVRVDGERAYARARRGEAVELAPRAVRIHCCDLVQWRLPFFEIRLACSKGTYVRTLIAEVGQRLGCGATMAALRRTRAGPFHMAQSVDLERMDPGCDSLPVLSMDRALSFLPALEVSPDEAARLRQGQPVSVPPARLAAGSDSVSLTRGPGAEHDAERSASLVRLRCSGLLIALGQAGEEEVWPKRVFTEEHPAEPG